MPTYRIYYAEREVGDSARRDPSMATAAVRPYRSGKYVSETEWEDRIEATDVPRALDQFFGQHARDRSELMWTDEDGETHPVQGLDYDPELNYIWIENGRLMEFQGIDEATPGMATCPLCNGHGEVDEALAEEEFYEVWGDEEEGEDETGADIRG